MTYIPLTLRYRPKRFQDLVGQEGNAKILRNMIISERVSHGVMFCGSRGTGKTSTARIYAKALSCTNRQDGEPCGECQSCASIDAERSIDVREIDGASSGSVDDVRKLRENALYAADSSAYKVFIIDEVHQLSREAFNALLKILETF